MRRDLQKAATEYMRMIEKLPNNKGCFYVSDIQQIMDACGGCENFNPYEAISLALNAGFMVGYRFAKKQDKEARYDE